MKEFKLEAKVTISICTNVFAKTLEEAIKLANKRTPMGVIATGGANEHENWMTDEIDGQPFDLREY